MPVVRFERPLFFRRERGASCEDDLRFRRCLHFVMSQRRDSTAAGANVRAQPPTSNAPLHHLPHLQGWALLVDLKAVQPMASKDQRNDFVLRDLRLSIADVVGAFVVPTSQLFRVGVASEEVYLAALERLSSGVRWTACGGALVYGWSTEDSLIRVRVSNVPEVFPRDLLLGHLAAFGQVVTSRRGVDKAFSACKDGIL